MKSNAVTTTRRRRTVKMSYLLALTFGGLVAVAVTAVLAFAVASNFKNTISLLDDKARQTVQALKLSLNMHLEPSRLAVDQLAKLYAGGRFDIGDDVRTRATLIALLASRPNVESVLIYDHNLIRQGAYRAPDNGFLEIEPSPVSSQDAYERLKSVKATDPARWSRLIYVPTVKTVYISAVAPLVRDGVIDGYLVAAISTARISEIMREIVPPDGVAFILNDDGRVVAHSKARSLGLDELRTAAEPGVDPVKIADAVLVRRDEWQPIDRFPKSAAAGISISELDHDRGDGRFGGPPSIIMNADLAGIGAAAWTVGVYFSGREIGEEFIRVWISMVIGVVALVLAVVVAVWLARRIARPLARVSNQASRIATLDIEDVADLPRSRVREIDTTAGAFNSMLEGLRAFTVYVPRSLVAKLVQSGMADTARSREARLTIMFSDIVGFTTLSESLSAQETAKLLNRHFEILVACVETEGGTVDKFLGDGMLAFWGAPDQLEHHADAAVRAALAIDRAVSIENENARRDGKPVIRLRIGIHTGPVIVGNIGTYDRVNYTIVGDSVNVCHRIETLGKVVAPDCEICILASADTLSDLTAAPALIEAGEHYLRGRTAPVRLWRLLSATASGTRAEDAANTPVGTENLGETID